MADRDEIARFCDQFLESADFADGAPNGLQVPGSDRVSRIVSGVSASRELFRRAADAGAQMALVHHGMFWGSGPRAPVDHREKARLKTLFDADLSLLAYHLPLDAHPTVGNNAILCRRLDIGKPQPFGRHGTRTIGFLGELDEPIGLDELVQRVRREVNPHPLVFGEGPPRIRRVAVISGGASGEVTAAADAGADCFITGEPKEPAMADARESGIHFIAAGHHATEVFGVRALGELLAERFSVEHLFISIDNPV